ncbi:MAG TPA: hypothetical protein VGM69_25490 [Chloroflexota bacterium]
MDHTILAGAQWLFVQQSAWITSAISAVMLWQLGNRRWWAPWLGLVGQVFWVALALHTDQPGLLPGIVLYTLIHVRNGLKWRAERRATAMGSAPASAPGGDPTGRETALPCR